MSAEGQDDGGLLLGIDLGSSETAVVSNHGYQGSLSSVVGYPRDIIAIKLLGKTQVFGEEALRHRRALTLYHPLRDGSSRDSHAAFELLGHIIDLASGDAKGPKGAVIAIPPQITPALRARLQGIADRLLDASLLVPAPFLAAYHLNQLDNCLIIDIGAAGVSLSILRGTIPSVRDQIVLKRAGDSIDERLHSLLSRRYPELSLSRELVRELKERFAFVGQATEPVLVRLRARGKPGQYDITSDLGLACASIVPEIVEQLMSLFKDLDPQDLDLVLKNIYLSGGGSQIKGLDLLIAEALSEYGQVRVRPIDDPKYAAANGALRLATDLSPGKWREFGLNQWKT